jgi:hypothetical protein
MKVKEKGAAMLGYGGEKVAASRVYYRHRVIPLYFHWL